MRAYFKVKRNELWKLRLKNMEKAAVLMDKRKIKFLSPTWKQESEVICPHCYKVVPCGNFCSRCGKKMVEEC